MDAKLASQPRLVRGFSLAGRAEEVWWDMPWWVRSPAFLGLVWLTLAAICLTSFCVVVNGIAQRSQQRQWAASEQARQEWLCASSRGRADTATDCSVLQGAVLQVSRSN
jgi:hypothetical protein